MTFVHRNWRLGMVAATLLIAAAAISPVLAATMNVSIDGKHFAPATIMVAQGDTVTWTVGTSIGEPHTVTSGKPADADKGSAFDSQKDDPGLTKLKDKGGTYSFTFDNAGTYAYFCLVHPVDMTGEVVVLAPGETAAAPAAPAAPAAAGGIPVQSKVIGAGILIITLVVLFGAAWLYRRMNPA